MNNTMHLLKVIEEENESIKIQDIHSSLGNQQYKYYNEEEEESDRDTISDDDEEPICGCGKALSSGWNCTQCRQNCTTCQRALAHEEICSRCHVERNTGPTIKETAI
ncbi:hypothetical protein INT47_002459 [Mucor saturninus]|uniref:Uncharacterized protein n=1 Tax=Mucor saturninus TaxID=64648 RepID=A0A8H7V9I3_9FUNG|nr:hypothetical protein INT47_002459 [Mucor saturninus]